MKNLQLNKLNKTHFDKSNWSGALSLWDKYTSPFIPSKEDVKNYVFILDALRQKKNILVLGATPQIREILFKINARIMIADFSSQMTLGMLRFSNQISVDKEEWIKANWMSLDEFLKNKYFDVIIGDLVLRNIDSKDQSRFLLKISKLLKNNGYFISRFHILDKNSAALTSNYIIRTTLDTYWDKENKSLEDLLASRLFDKNTNFLTNLINKRNVVRDIRKYLEKDVKNKRKRLILKNILKKWTVFGTQNQRTWTQRSEKDLKGLLSKNFILHNTKIASDYEDGAFYPIYVLKNKKQKE